MQLDFIRPGTPVPHASIESFNGRLSDECLNVHPFKPVEDAKATIEAWRVDYDQCRPHSSLGHLTPDAFVERRQNPEAAEPVSLQFPMSRFWASINQADSLLIHCQLEGVSLRRIDYNQRRPHSSVGHMTPEYVARRPEDLDEQV